MKKTTLIVLSALLLIALISTSTAVEAQLVTYLPSWLNSVLNGSGVYGLIVGAAVIAGGYLVYHASSSVYSYFTAYTYTTVSSHAYTHALEFPTIWGGRKPSTTEFNNECKKTMNSKSLPKYVQKYDGRLISYNPSTGMVAVGETDGKTVITCFPKPQADVTKKISTGEWTKVIIK
jgi:hypothetical protein